MQLKCYMKRNESRYYIEVEYEMQVNVHAYSFIAMKKPDKSTCDFHWRMKVCDVYMPEFTAV